MTSSPSSPTSSRTRPKALIVVGIVLGLVIVSTLALVLLGVGPFHPYCGGAPVILAKNGTAWTIAPHSRTFVGALSLSTDRWGLEGSFTAGPGITAYLLTSAENTSWTGNGAPSASVWTSGHNVSSGIFTSTLYPGTYDVVWWNENSTTTSHVNATSEILAFDEKTC